MRRSRPYVRKGARRAGSSMSPSAAFAIGLFDGARGFYEALEPHHNTQITYDHGVIVGAVISWTRKVAAFPPSTPEL